MTRPGIEHRSPGPLANTRTAGPIDQLQVDQPKKEQKKKQQKNKNEQQ